MSTQHDSIEPRRPSVLEQKWSREVIDAGWVGIPSLLLEFAPELGLDADDVMIIAIIADHWWAPESRPYPSKKLLAKRLGVDPRTIQRRITAMEERGLIRRQYRRSAYGGSSTNIYHLDGLRAALKALAPSGRRYRRKASMAALDQVPTTEGAACYGAVGGFRRTKVQRHSAVECGDHAEELGECGPRYDDDAPVLASRDVRAIGGRARFGALSGPRRFNAQGESTVDDDDDAEEPEDYGYGYAVDNEDNDP